ncbi:uncharacterized protein [Mytilus edulis]|uniref:uncharacterized protein n=1 Tax=Mytilus edulis TaxID=6550 RepID=UPI0039EFA9D1
MLHLLVCGKIDNCLHRNCTDDNKDLTCVWCDGEIADRPYWKAYTGGLDRISCKKTCSWRTDSTRCFPGTCADELAASCQCAANFSGTHCEKIDEAPYILFNHGQFYESHQHLIKMENDPNYIIDGHPIIWTNEIRFSVVETVMSAKYFGPNITLDSDHYVRDFKVGLVEMKTTLKLYTGSSIYTKEQLCGPMYARENGQLDPNDKLVCNQSFGIGAWPSFKHDDKVIYTVSATNGGFVEVQDRDVFFETEVNETKISYYQGKTTTREFEYHWDLELPYHCSVTSGTACAPFVSVQSDITNNPVITFSWGGWSDDMSGISQYQYQLFDMGKGDGGLMDGANSAGSGTLPDGKTSSTVTLTEPGMYTIHLSAFDNANNSKTGRGIFLFDNESVVTLHGDDMKCPTASKDTAYLWVIEDIPSVKIIWPGRFQNIRHNASMWLESVLPLAAGTDPIYEDLYGNRTSSAIQHVDGIVDFQVAYEVHDPTLKDFQIFTSLPANQLDDEFVSLAVDWGDGDRLNVTVQAFDILRESNIESLVVYRDVSPPIIENIWLTKGDRVNISVHSVEDFTEMTIEWEAYDDHSGLDTVYWKLYDSYGTFVEHGHEDLPAQGQTDNLTECQTKYLAEPRGPNCYCTPFMGCFHRHFQVKPQIKDNGLKAGLDRGNHDSDYYIEIAVKNKALVQTILTKKITVDISPPHTGVVHDGLPGNPEIDYQQGMDLNAYWDQFFDRESGVFFYQYSVDTSCADKSAFSIDLNNTNIVETYNTFGSHTVIGDGTYYFTVVAYNRALDPSEPVCSDGVTIDSSVPRVKEVVVKDAVITGGLVTDVNQTSYYILGSDRVRRLIQNPTSDCVNKATTLIDIDLYPLQRFDNNNSLIEVDGIVFCSNTSSAPSNIGLSLYKASLLEMSWKPLDIPAKIFDYEVGFSSTAGSAAPDIMAFESTKQHAHVRITHANIPDATEIYIILKTISKSNVEGLTTLGPCFMDTTSPDFTGSITVSLSGEYLVASWALNAFSDSEELFDMDYQFAIGQTPYGTEIQNFKPVEGSTTCVLSTSPTCTAVNITNLEWNIHGHHTYYISIKVTNSAGLVNIQTSTPYIHNVQLPAEGVVLDIDTESFSTDIPLKDIEDTDFQKITSSMTARWAGFAHPHLDVTYSISIGTTMGGSDVVSLKDVGTSLAYQETGLSLTPYQTYYFTVTAISSAGNTNVSSDGVTMVTEGDILSGVVISDGVPCNMTDLIVDHHEEDNRINCENEPDVQLSLNSLKAYWSVPDNIKPYTTDAFIAVEQRSPVGNIWTIFRDYIHVSTVFDISIDDLVLSPGMKYRLSLKLCARTFCFSPVSTDGVMVMANPPVTGDIIVEHQNTTVTGGAEKLIVSFDKFYDPDIEDTTEKYSAIWKYEYAVTDNSVKGKTYTTWTNLNTFTTNGNRINFEMVLTGEMDFSRCKRFSIRGYDQVRLHSIVSTEIKDCKAFNPVLINPNIVLDAVGAASATEGIGMPIYLEENDRWKPADEEYTPYKNLISAVWPTLRHGKNTNYKYAIIDARNVDVTTYYKKVGQLNLVDPCIPDAIRCGETHREFMNEEFTHNELVHGTRYTVCIFAPPTAIVNEDWILQLPAVSACSDGIIVDLTSPTAGRLWIGHNIDTIYQTSDSDLYVNWDNFQDVEEFNNGPHPSGIKEYILGIGSSSGGNDVVAFENVGVLQHKALHQLILQNGYKYYATLKAVDFANRETEVVSEPVLIDTTPPVTSNNPIIITNRHITSTTEIDPCWKGVFLDLESGIDYYMWSVGSEPGYIDMMSYLKVVDEECGRTDKNKPLDLKDGHFYYINVRAFNKAGLSSLATSWAFQVDTTPPTPGHVYDGDKSQLTGSVKDIDYQTETKVLHAYWEGFHESHSTIRDYYVSIGTCQQCEDILQEQAIGITYEFTLENIHLGTGLRYYTTVTACNTADMCTTVTSDGVIIDNSAPVAGKVQDGTGFIDTEYQSMTTYISAKWYGFDDPQSGLEKYAWRAGTTKGGTDIIPATVLHLTETAAIYNTSLGLPLNQRIFVTVRAYNKVGLWSESTSNGFLVDTSAPVITKTPTFSADFGIKELTQVYRTSMKVEWTVDDDESFIKRQFLSVKSHIGGEFMLSSQSVNGIARSYVFSGLDLHDGVTYYVTLISCNSAEICVTSTSPGMFVDSTPPSRGMFAITTDHAADPELLRHATGWMFWSQRAVNLAWLGFSDLHSDIDHYKVAVGSIYMGQDLSENTDDKYYHTNTNTDHGDEGKVQLFKVETKTLTNYDTLYISVWAVNGVGIRSKLVHSAFSKVPGGPLDLIRRCDAMSCDGHCVCAPQDQKCPLNPSLGSCNDVSTSKYIKDMFVMMYQQVSISRSCDGHCVCAPQDQKCPLNPSLGSCNDVSTNNNNNLLLVRDSNGYSSSDQAVTASDNILRGIWLVSQVQGMKPLWYEWSVGYTQFDFPSGIYDPVEEKVWQDGGQLKDCIFSTKPGDKLGNTLTYSVFVRIWYSEDQYAVFKSNGIVVMGQAPVLASVRGKTVIEKIRGTTVKDTDFMQIGRPITFDWSSKFLEYETTIEKYNIYLSTFPGGHDILRVAHDIPGTDQQFNMTGLQLTPGVVHYTNVIAYNYAGAHTTATSDGFVVDSILPKSGIVYDGLGSRDLEFMNSSDSVSAHWHGFTDTESGIATYYWCFGTRTYVNNRKRDKTECSVIGWTNAGLHVSASSNISTEIPQGTRLYAKVYSVDNAGLKSDIIVSDGAIIDKTPPVPEKFIHVIEKLGNNTSFENTSGDVIMFGNVTSFDICMVSTSYHPLSWIPSPFTCMAVVSSDVNLAREGRSFLFIRGSVHQELPQVIAGRLYRVSFFSSHLSITDSVAANKEGFIQFGDGEKLVFLIYTKSYRKDGHGTSSDREDVSWHTHHFYFRPTENAVNITIGSMDMTTGIFLDDISVQEVNLTTGASSKHVLGHVVYLHEWSSIHGSWSFSDPDSPIIDYTWAIGYAEGGTQIQPFRSVGLMNFAFNNNVTLVHNTFIYVTAIATNAAGLRGVSFSDPILVDLTPPDIKYIYDGRGADEDSWTFNEVVANWEVEDYESGIKFCKWAIGYMPGKTDLLVYTEISSSPAVMEFDYSVLEGYTIYTTLNCENNAGLTYSLSTDGVKISNTPPSISSVQMEVLSLSSTEYNPRDWYLGLTDTMRIKWSGFTDSIGVETYKVKYPEQQSESMFFPANQEVLFTHFTKMSLTDDKHDVSTQAMNKLFLRSLFVTTNVTVQTAAPLVDNSKSLGLSYLNNEVVVSWGDVFTSDYSLYYEISAGSFQSGVNIIQWQFTNQTSITFGIPATVKTETGTAIYVNVRAISVGGYYAQKTGNFKLP